MKRSLLLLAIVLMTSLGASAQLFKKKSSEIEPAYAKGEVPVVNAKVTFEKRIPADGLTAGQVEERMNAWLAKRFVEPTVISAKRFESEKPHTAIVKGEEYIVFKNTFFVLSRARMYYYLTLTAEDGACTFNLTRITYWYDDEDEKGGIKMIAEDWITDDNAFNKKGGLKKFEGKFRCKTIDLKEQLIKELTEALNSTEK